MARIERALNAQFIGIGNLKDYQFIINSREVANVIKSPGSIVYGIL